MVSEATETKCKVIIKAFLLANKGKKFTSKEIADFINHNDFGLGKYSLHNYTVTNGLNLLIVIYWKRLRWNVKMAAIYGDFGYESIERKTKNIKNTDCS